MFHDDGASTARTGSLVLCSASMTLGNGSRTSPEKEKPKIASMMWSVWWRAVGKSSVKGMWRSLSCLVRRWVFGVKLIDFEKRVKRGGEFYLVELVLALLGVVYGWLVSVVEEMAGCYEAVSTWISLLGTADSLCFGVGSSKLTVVTWTAGYEDALAFI